MILPIKFSKKVKYCIQYQQNSDRQLLPKNLGIHCAEYRLKGKIRNCNLKI